jgi:hypothetical protein
MANRKISTPCVCTGCKKGLFKLHIGDRLVIVPGDWRGQELIGIQENLRKRGVWIQGQVGEDTAVLVIGPGSSDVTNRKLAREKGVPIVEFEDLGDLLQNVASFPRTQFQIESNFSKLDFVNFRKVLPISIDDSQSATLQAFTDRNHLGIGVQIRPKSLAFAVTGHPDGLKEPTAQILLAHGVPVFVFQEIERDLVSGSN